MLVRIPTGSVRLGMYIDRFEGEWIDSPFWKSGFLLAKPSDLERLQKSTVPFVVIDDGKGAAAINLRAPSRLPAQRAAPRPPPNALTPKERTFLQTSQACRRAVREIFVNVQSGEAVDAERTSVVVETIARTVEENPTTLIGLTRLKTMETYTFAHSVSVSALLVRFARHLTLDPAEVQDLGMAGLLHDIGKMRTPPAILTKTGPLSEAEIAVIQQHPVDGVEILSKTAGMSPTVIDVCRHHHERIDGTGYPDRLAGDAVSFHARIAAICDVFDALTSARPYKLAWSTERALSSMASWTGHFDRRLLDEFVASLGRTKLPPPFKPVDGTFSDGSAVNGYSDPSA